MKRGKEEPSLNGCGSFSHPGYQYYRYVERIWNLCDEYARNGEVRFPPRSKTTTVYGGFFDGPNRLALKGSDDPFLCGNDGATRVMRHSPPISLIRNIELRALQGGIGTDSLGFVPPDHWIPLHAVGCETMLQP